VKNGVQMSQLVTGYETFVYIGDPSFMCSGKWQFWWYSTSTDKNS